MDAALTHLSTEGAWEPAPGSPHQQRVLRVLRDAFARASAPLLLVRGLVKHAGAPGAATDRDAVLVAAAGAAADVPQAFAVSAIVVGESQLVRALLCVRVQV